MIAVEVHTVNQPLQWIYFNKELYSINAFEFLFHGLSIKRIQYQNFVDFMAMKQPMGGNHLKEHCAMFAHLCDVRTLERLNDNIQKQQN